jgi:hypothetical protein
MEDNLINSFERARKIVPGLKLKQENLKISVIIDDYEVFSSNGSLSEDFVLVFLNGIALGVQLKN